MNEEVVQIPGGNFDKENTQAFLSISRFFASEVHVEKVTRFYLLAHSMFLIQILEIGEFAFADFRISVPGEHEDRRGNRNFWREI